MKPLVKGMRTPWGRWSTAAVLVAVGACTANQAPRRGQLMVALQTDMSIPKDVTHIRVKTKLGAELREEYDFQIAPDGKFYIPGTIAVVEGSTPNPVVSVEVIGIRQRGTGTEQFEARTFSKTTTTIPRERTVLLEVPVQWLCDDTAVDDGSGEYFSSCTAGPNGEERACVAGTCADVSVDPNQLVDYKASLVFGGGASSTDPLARCFDTVSCFDRGTDVDTADLGKDCTLLVPDDGRPVNVGLRLAAGGDGICHGDTQAAPCYVPLDQDDKWGWHFSATPPAGKREVVLPQAACASVQKGRAAAIRVTTTCETKTTGFGTCGPWSQVTESGAPSGAGGAPSGSGGKAGAGRGAGGASTGSAGEGTSEGGATGNAAAGSPGEAGSDTGGNAGEIGSAGAGNASGGGGKAGSGGSTGSGGAAGRSGGKAGASGAAGGGGMAGAMSVSVPAEWSCYPSAYSGHDGCDCGCGAPDPDCSGPLVGNCDFCDDTGTCATDLDSTHTKAGCYGIDLAQNWQCGTASGWTCAPQAYGSGNACDCGCGIIDADCATASSADCDDCSDPDSCTGGGSCSLIDSADNSTCGT
jgi:hypothetical protein